MAHFRYVSDNPFRLLGVGSALSQDELHHQAASLAQAAAPARAAHVGLRRVFGDEDLDRCPVIVRAIARDPKRRTIYRCFWPLHYAAPPDAAPGIEDFERCFPVRDPQSVFLPNWFAFLIESDAGRLESALNGFRELCEDEAYTAHLGRILQNEGESAESAERLVAEAREAIRALLLGVACRRAVELWESGRSDSAAALLRAVCACPFPDAADRALRAEVVPAGDRAMAGLRRARNASDWSAPDPAEHALRELAEAVRDRIPTAALWVRTTQERVAGPAPSPPDAGKPSPAPTSWERMETVGGDDRIWKNVRRLKSGPILFHVIGTGTRMVGLRPFGGQSAWYYSTLYLCVLFLPLVPLGYYVVSHTPSGGYYFHGRAPLTQAHRGHIITLCTLCASVAALLLVRIIPFDLSGVSGAVPAERSVAAPRPAVSRPRSSENVAVADTATQRRKRLVAEWKTLSEQYQTDLAELEADKAALDALDRTLAAGFARLRSERSVLDRTDQRQVDDFNQRLTRLRASEREASRRWKEHESRLAAYNRRVDRLNAIAQALRSAKEF